jgi:hypothetical protein
VRHGDGGAKSFAKLIEEILKRGQNVLPEEE